MLDRYQTYILLTFTYCILQMFITPLPTNQTISITAVHVWSRGVSDVGFPIFADADFAF